MKGCNVVNVDRGISVQKKKINERKEIKQDSDIYSFSYENISINF